MQTFSPQLPKEGLKLPYRILQKIQVNRLKTLLNAHLLVQGVKKPLLKRGGICQGFLESKVLAGAT